MSDQERERLIAKEGDKPESDVEGHLKRRAEGGEAPADEAGMRREGEGDDPDVEGHLKR
jgi:hypothetical protein